MPVFPMSRYVKAAVVRVADSTGSYHPTIFPAGPQPHRFNYTEYLVMDGDRIDTLAARFLGSETSWWQIADANPEILKWVDIPMGTVLRMPYV